MLYTHEISDPETFVRREARADVLMLSSCESILPRLALSQEQKRKIQTLEINVPPHSRREKPAPDGLPIKFRSINSKNQSDTFLIRNDPVFRKVVFEFESTVLVCTRLRLFYDDSSTCVEGRG